MTGHRLRTDCPELRRKLSWETVGKSIFMIVGCLGKSLQHRTPPKWSLETPAGFKLSLGGRGSPPIGSLGLPRVSLPWIPWVPKGPLPWDPLGSQGSPPMGSLGLPRVPSHVVPWAPEVPLPWCKQPKNLVVWRTRLAGDVVILLDSEGIHV